MMGKSLVLAEKPSVGRELARVLGVNGKNNGYFENNNYIVTWALRRRIQNVAYGYPANIA